MQSKQYHSISQVKIAAAILSIGAVLFLSSCSSVRKVPDGQYLLTKNEWNINTKRISSDNLDVFLKQQPNRKTFLGMKLPLAMYNASNPDCKFFINKWMINSGEPPVILDTVLIVQSVENVSEQIRNMGYYDFMVSDSVVYKKNKKAKVIYSVDVTSPIRIQNVRYEIQDTALNELVLSTRYSSHLYTGQILSVENLEAERTRIISLLRNRGYYEFNRRRITFQADTTIGDFKADLTLRLNKVESVSNNVIEYKSHKQYVIKEIYVNTDYDPAEAYRDSLYAYSFDTVFTKGMYFLYNKELKVRPAVIDRVNLINVDDIYSDVDVKQTYANLSNLNLYRSVTIQFKEQEQQYAADTIVPLVCEILLTPSKPQGYKLDLEISTSGESLLSIAPGIGYDHQNLLKGAEYFQTTVRGAYQQYLGNKKGRSSTSKEFGVSTSLTLSQFIMPINFAFSKRSIPHTTFALSYSYQDRPDYTRQMAGASFGYSWRASEHTSYIFNPIVINLVKMKDVDTTFINSFRNPFLRELYKDHFIGGATASMEYRSSISARQAKRVHYVRIGMDIAGNLLSLFNSALKKNEDGLRKFMGSAYAQYAKADVSYSINQRLARSTSIVYHAYFGIGRAYGNSNVLPLEKMFFAGGANSLRGWQALTLGPGSAPITDTTLNVPNQVGDMMFEANIEYRFKLVSSFEGALFIDAGNIWSLNKIDDRPGAQFKFNKFYKDIAVSTGLGLRLNLDFLVLRVDVGFKTHDPYIDPDLAANPNQGRRGFISPLKWLRSGNNTWHFALNYPF
ncbi:MAG: outer membrane protein assembly factor [Prevotellaceae bacterium]|jgi:outer membrane protein assembly factor BamA|nr:outer membrane protein assembly factor [Prevotellaceae bacterium]